MQFIVTRTSPTATVDPRVAGPSTTPEAVAACYGVSVNDECPTVTLDTPPAWAVQHFADREVEAAFDRAAASPEADEMRAAFEARFADIDSLMG